MLHHGSVVDVGTHEELLARCARYRLLLSGHDEDLEAAESLPGKELPSGVTPSLWEHQPPEEGTGAFGAVGLPPEKAVLVAKLPTASDSPGLDIVQARQPDTDFRMRRLWRPFRTGLLLTMGLIVLDAACQLAVPWLTRHGVDEGVRVGDAAALFGLSAVAFGIVVFDWGVRRLQVQVTGRTGERMLFWLRVKLYAHLQRLGLDFYEREQAGRIMTRMTTDLDSLTTFIQTGFGQAAVAVLSFAGVLCVMLTIDPGLTLALFAMIPVFVVVVLVYRGYSNRAYELAREQLSFVNASLQESVAGIRVTQAYCREDRTIARFRGLSSDLYDARMRSQSYLAVFFSFIEFANELAVAIVLGVGAWRVSGGSLTAGGITAFLLYITLLFSPIQQMSQVLDGYQRAAVGVRRIGQLLRTPTSTPVASSPVAVGQVSGELEFVDVRFRYEAGSEEALRGIDLRISPGENVAVVGETVSGDKRSRRC